MKALSVETSGITTPATPLQAPERLSLPAIQL